MIGKLFAVEQQAKEDGLDAIATRELRQKQSKPILGEIQCRLDDWCNCPFDWSIEVLPKSPIGQAVSCARGQWLIGSWPALRCKSLMTISSSGSSNFLGSIRHVLSSAVCLVSNRTS